MSTKILSTPLKLWWINKNRLKHENFKITLTLKNTLNVLSLLMILAITVSCHKKNNDNDNAVETAEIEKEAQAELKKPKFEYGFNLSEFTFKNDTIKSGDSFGNIMSANGLSVSAIHNITTQIQKEFNTARINAGRPYTIVKYKNYPDSLAAFIYHKNNIDYTVVHLGDSVSVELKKHPVSIKRRAVSGIINSSLYIAMEEAGATPALIQELSALYQWKIDFFRIQKGDKFKVIYNEKYINDTTYVGIENIEAAEFTHYSEPYYAFRFGKDKKTGEADFYDEKANSLQNFFLKAPVNYTRISSRYNPKRFHPVQKRWKAHLGTDYAAPTGTPIHSTADGVVIASSYTSGNGNYVKVKHNEKYTTQYLHMSKRNARVGQRVKQGDVIGYVGMTGLATGPHVCYRFWVNGKQEDPFRQKMPNSEPLADSLKPEYLEKIAPLKRELENMVVEEPAKKENLARVP